MRVPQLFGRSRGQDEAPDSYEGGEPEGNQDPWEGMDDDTRERIEAYAAQRAEEEREAIREGLTDLGLDVGNDYQPVFRDLNKARQYFQPLIEREQGQAPPQGQAPAPAPQPQAQAPDPADEMPDPYTSPREFAEWNRRQIRAEAERIADERLKPTRDQLEQQDRRSREMYVREVLDYVPDAIAQYAPQLEEWLEDPRFEAAMSEAMLTVPPEQWSNYANLAKLAGVVAIDLMDQPAPRQQQFQAPRPRAADGRFTATPPTRGRAQTRWTARDEEEEPPQPQWPTGRRQARAALSRAALGATGPSRDGGRQQREREYSEVVRAHADRTGVSLEEAQAAFDSAMSQRTSTGPDPERDIDFRKKRLEKMR